MANEKEINLITGERGFSHVTSEDARVQNRLTYGSGRHFLKYGKEFDFSTIDTNTIRIYDGAAYNQGAFIKIDRDNYADVTVDNGLQGLKRSDLIVLRYKRNLYTQLESASVVVLKGESTEGTPVDPEYAVGDIAQGESVDEIPMYRINFTGVNFTIEKLFSTEERSLTIVENTMNNHISDGGIHIKPTERIDWNDANSKKHTHSNKSILDKITQTLLDNWSDAYTHISDAVKHITADERTKWNQAASPVDNLNETTTGKSLDAHQGYVLNEAISTNSYGEYAGGKNLILREVYGFINPSGKINIDNDSVSFIFYAKANETYTISSDVVFTGSAIRKGYVGTLYPQSNNDKVLEDFSQFTIKNPTFTCSKTGYYMVYAYDTKILGTHSQIEEGTTATDYEPYIKSNYQLGNDKADKSEVCANLLKPTLETTTQNGVTCTANGDGTYTLNGTATAATNFNLIASTESIPIAGKKLKMLGTKGASSDKFCLIAGYYDSSFVWKGEKKVYDEGIVIDENSVSYPYVRVAIYISSGATFNDLLVKPMLTTDLTATYDDFVPYTGDKGRINEEVAELRDNTYYTSEEKCIGNLLGDQLYRVTFSKTYSSATAIATGVDVLLNGQGGLLEGNSTFNSIKDLVNVESFIETPTYKLTNYLAVKKDKTGYFYVRNIVDSVPATRLILTLYYTKN